MEDKIMENNLRPSHYKGSNMECIDAMLAAFNKEEVLGFCKLNAFKYIWREEYKNGLEDIKKASWYINKYIEIKENT